MGMLATEQSAVPVRSEMERILASALRRHSSTKSNYGPSYRDETRKSIIRQGAANEIRTSPTFRLGGGERPQSLSRWG